MNKLSKFLFLICILVTTSCSEQGFYRAIDGIDAGLRVTNNLLDAYDRVKTEIGNNPTSRGASEFVDMSEDVKTGDVLQGDEKQHFLKAFEIMNYGNAKCKIYLCKENTSKPCNPKVSDCNCKCAYK